jgi:hypothetical protein
MLFLEGKQDRKYHTNQPVRYISFTREKDAYCFSDAPAEVDLDGLDIGIAK